MCVFHLEQGEISHEHKKAYDLIVTDSKTADVLTKGGMQKYLCLKSFML